jgi:transcription antitermination factor NusG
VLKLRTLPPHEWFLRSSRESIGNRLVTHYFEIRYMTGVTGFVSAGPGPLVVSEEIVDSVRARCMSGVVQLSLKSLQLGEETASRLRRKL